MKSFLSIATIAAAFAISASSAVQTNGRHAGQATVYLPGDPSGGGPAFCTGSLERNKDYVVSIKKAEYFRLEKAGFQACNTCVRFDAPVVSKKAGRVGATKSMVARVVDTCTGKECRDFDMSIGLFRQWQSVNVNHGRPIDDGPGYIDINYEFVPCSKNAKGPSSLTQLRHNLHRGPSYIKDKIKAVFHGSSSHEDRNPSYAGEAAFSNGGPVPEKNRNHFGLNVIPMVQTQDTEAENFVSHKSDAKTSVSVDSDSDSDSDDDVYSTNYKFNPRAHNRNDFDDDSDSDSD